MENYMWIFHKKTQEIIAKPKISYYGLDHFFISTSPGRLVLAKDEITKLVEYIQKTELDELSKHVEDIQKTKLDKLNKFIVEAINILLSIMEPDDKIYFDPEGDTFISKNLLWFEDKKNVYVFVENEMANKLKSFGQFEQIIALTLIHNKKQKYLSQILTEDKVEELKRRLNLNQ